MARSQTFRITDKPVSAWRLCSGALAFVGCSAREKASVTLLGRTPWLCAAVADQENQELDGDEPAPPGARMKNPTYISGTLAAFAAGIFGGAQGSSVAMQEEVL